MCIKSDAKNGRQYQKWLFAVRIGSISIFLLKGRVLNLTISKRKKFTLAFKGWNRPVCLLFGFTRVSFSQNLLHFTLGQWSESWRSPFPLFFSLSRTLAREKRSENCLRFGTGGPSLSLYLLLSLNVIFCTALTMATRAKKNFLAKQFAHAISSVHYRDFENAYVYWIWLPGSASYVITFVMPPESDYLLYGRKISQSSKGRTTGKLTYSCILLLTTRLCDFTVANAVLKTKQTFSDVPLTVKPLDDMTETTNTQEVSLQWFFEHHKWINGVSF